MKVTAKEAIDYSSISNINRLINIDWYWLISIVIDYRFHRLSTPVSKEIWPPQILAPRAKFPRKYGPPGKYGPGGGKFPRKFGPGGGIFGGGANFLWLTPGLISLLNQSQSSLTQYIRLKSKIPGISEYKFYQPKIIKRSKNNNRKYRI